MRGLVPSTTLHILLVVVVVFVVFVVAGAGVEVLFAGVAKPTTAETSVFIEQVSQTSFYQRRELKDVQRRKRKKK